MFHKIILAKRAEEDKLFWKKNDPKCWNRIEALIENIKKTPYSGLGKPEPLRFSKFGYWSRRIDAEHRLVYKLDQGILYIAQCRYHY